MASPKLRIGLVGAGKIARDEHISAITGRGDLELAAVVSRRGARIAADVPHFRSLDELLEQAPDVAAVVLCTPPQVRGSLAVRTLEAGRHVFLEKPPAATLGEACALIDLARKHRCTLFASWHSRYAVAVAPAHAWLAGREIRSVEVSWKEDVRVWHPGQSWIWEPGGLGVFDPGINALSILTAILPQPFALTKATLEFPENRQAPIAAELSFADTRATPITAAFDFRQTGPQTWDIRVDTTDGVLLLSQGGAEMRIDGDQSAVPAHGEYPALYERFAGLVAERAIDADLAPLRHVADAFLCGRRVIAEPFDF